VLSCTYGPEQVSRDLHLLQESLVAAREADITYPKPEVLPNRFRSTFASSNPQSEQGGNNSQPTQLPDRTRILEKALGTKGAFWAASAAAIVGIAATVMATASKLGGSARAFIEKIGGLVNI